MNMNLPIRVRRVAMVLALAIPIGAVAMPSPAAASNTAAEEANMQTARDLFAAIFTAQDFAVADRYLGPEYIQHAADVADGKVGLARVIAEIVEQVPKISYEIKHMVADGNMVTLMSHIRPTRDSRGQMMFNIYRFDAGKIVEHWETVQDIPETSANGNGVF